MEDRTIEQDDAAFIKRQKAADELFIDKANKAVDIISKASTVRVANDLQLMDAKADFFSKIKQSS